MTEMAEFWAVKSRLERLEHEVDGLDRRERERDARDRALLMRGIMMLGALLTAALGFIWAIFKNGSPG